MRTGNAGIGHKRIGHNRAGRSGAGAVWLAVLLIGIMIFLPETCMTASAASAPAAPKLKSVQSAGYSSLKVTWSKVSGADGYCVYRKNAGGSWEQIASLKSGKTVSYTDGKLTAGKTYTYTVRAYRNVNGQRLKSSYDKKGISGKPVPGKTSLNFEKKSSTSVKLTWKKVSGANGYIVYRKESPKDEHRVIRTIISGDTLNFTDKNIKKDKTYYYTIRAFRTVGGKDIYGRAASSVKWNGKVVVLDPGHQLKGNSQKEPLGPGSSRMKAKVTSGTEGCVTKLAEYQLNLDVSLKLGKELKKRGYQVIYTRTTNNVNISNAGRAKIANNAKADAFIRIHANSSDDSGVHGAMTICQTSKNPYNASCYKQSKKLASNILDALVSSTGCRKQIVWETDTMSGINWSEVPVTIVEMGYMSNAAEDRNMAKDSYQDKIAAGIADGIDKTLLK